MANVITWETFGCFLRVLRNQHGMTQVGLAEALGCTRSYLWHLEHCKRRPSKRFLRYIRAQFQLDSHELQTMEAFGLMIEYRCDQLEL